MVEFAIVSKVGGREINEDSVTYGKKDDVFFFVVADGLGGHGRGEVASSIAAQTIQKTMEECANEPLDSMISTSILRAQEMLLEEQKRLRARDEMKTTVVVLGLDNNSVCWGHVGDSRLYGFNKNKVAERTLDHSIPQMLVLSRKIPERKIRNHPQRNMLLRVLGIEWEQPRYEIADVKPLTDYQAFLLCTDGFWELIDEKQMSKLLKKSKTEDEWLEKMTELVEKAGQKKDMDNYTAVAVWLTNK